MYGIDTMQKKIRRMAGMLLSATLLVAMGSTTALASVPAATVTAATTIPSVGLASSQVSVALDACGNIYTMTNYNGTIWETPAGGGTPITVQSGSGYVQNSLWIDPAKANLYAPTGGNALYRIPIINCVPQTGSETNISVGNLGAISYYFLASSMAADSAGNVFIGTSAACCAPANELLEESSDDTAGATLLTNLSNPITAITVDSSFNIYYVAGGALYELPYNATTKAYASAPVAYGSGYKTVVGVTLDALGNLYVADSENAEIFEIPLEGNGSATALNPSDQYVVAEGVDINASLAIDAAGNLYYTNGDSTIYELTRGNANFGASVVGIPVTVTLNVVFNQSVKPASIHFVTASGVFASLASGGTCVVDTSYAAGDSCTIKANFSPVVPGVATGAVVLATSSGVPISSVSLYGKGIGAGFTADPGSAASVGSGFKTPAAAALDVAGNLFIADPASSTVWEVPSGASTPVSLGTNLAAPAGVAVDGAGNLFIADTGNNRVVEIPIAGGALSVSAQFDVVPGGASLAGTALSSPAGISIDAQGGLYIADTGNNRVVYLPRSEDWNLTAAVPVGSGLSAPLAITIVPSGLIYIADSGNGRVVSVPNPNPAAPQTVVASGYKQPSALATDAAGDLFIVDQGHFAVLRIPNIGGVLAPASAFNLTDGIANPYGLVLDAAGNAYVTDNVNATVSWIARSSATQSFGQWNPGSTSDPRSFLIENSGNAALILGSPIYTAAGDTADFMRLTTGNGACASGASIPVGTNCVLTSTFKPAALSDYSETLAFSSNARNAASPQVTFSGTGAVTVPTTTSFTITSPSGNPAYGEPIEIAATVTGETGTPAGTIQLLVDGLPATRATLDGNGSATLSLPNGLTGGSHTLQASYEGAVVGFTAYSASQSQAQTISVARVPTATALALGTLYTDPVSQPAGTPFTIMAAVGSPSAGTPTGSVVFTIKGATGGTVSQSVPLTASSTGFAAVYTYTPPAPAQGTPYDALTVEAIYSGDGNFQGSHATGSLDVAAASGIVLTKANASTLSSSSTSNGSVTFTSTSYGGWQGVVGYQCVASTLPANAICVFSPGQVSVLASTAAVPYPPATTSLKVVVNNPPNSPAQSSTFWWLGLLLTTGLLQQRRRLASCGLWRSLVIFAAVLTSVTAIGAASACSNGASFITPAGSSSITVIGSSDPYIEGKIGTATQTCGDYDATTNSSNPAAAPCSQTTFQITLNVK